MRRFRMLLAVVLAAVMVVGCASGQKPVATAPTTIRNAVPATSQPSMQLTYPDVGVTLTAAPVAYRPAVSRSEVLSLFRQSGHGSVATGRPTVRLWTVGGSGSHIGYPAWVLTFRHTKPTSYGLSTKPNCVFVAIYDVGHRVWTWFFQNCPDTTPSRPSCDYGCTPANQPTLDAAASAAHRLVGPRYYTGVVVSDATNSVIVYLAHAPQSILQRLNATHPGTYVIRNHAPRPLSAVMKLMHSFNPNALKPQGITISGYGPTQDGYLQVGVTNHVAQAQAKLNALYGHNIIRVVKQALAVAA
jgi:hypothetical protein